jgi:hypothetical protein
VSNVVELATAGRVPVSCLRTWAHEWIDAIMDGEYGEVKSLVLVAENQSGEVNHVAQSDKVMDGYRLIVLLTHCTRLIGDDLHD